MEIYFLNFKRVKFYRLIKHTAVVITLQVKNNNPN